MSPGNHLNPISAGVSVSHVPEVVRGAAAGGSLLKPLDTFAADNQCVIPSPPYAGFTVRSWGEILDMKLPPRKFILGDLFACGQVQVMYGQGGIGKSRQGLNIARNQVLSLPFLGMATGNQPMRHLFIGSENDMYRWQIDMERMTKDCTTFQREQLRTHIHVTTLEKPGDTFITMDDDGCLSKWMATLAFFKPDVLWVDPWGDILIGDGFDSDVRATVSTLRKLVGEVNPECGIVILAHARTGTNNIAQAAGFDSANFGKDSKALFSVARAVVNTAPYDASENPDLVWVPAKNNNAKRSEPLRIRLHSETLLYTKVEVLDVEAWQADVKASQNERRNKAGVEFDDPAVIGLCTPPVTKTELHAAVRKLGVTERDTRAGLDRLLRTGKIVERPAGNRNKKLIGTPQSYQT